MTDRIEFIKTNSIISKIRYTIGIAVLLAAAISFVIISPLDDIFLLTYIFFGIEYALVALGIGVVIFILLWRTDTVQGWWKSSKNIARGIVGKD